MTKTPPVGNLVGATGTNSNSLGGVTVTPNGTLDLTGIANAAVPVGSGTVDEWGLPAYLQGKVLWFDTGEHNQTTQQTTNQASPTVVNNGQDLKPGEKAFTKALDSKSSFDINASAEEIMKQFRALSYNDPKAFMAIQTALADGPWASALKTSGMMDPQTEKALAVAMTSYLQLGATGVAVSFKQYLLDSAHGGPGGLGTTNNPGGSSGSSGGALGSVSLTDPAELKAQVQTAAQSALGHVLTAAQVNSFVTQFHANQVSQQHSSGSIFDKMNSGANAMQYAQESDPTGFNQHQTQGYADTFANMFLSGNSSTGGVAPVVPLDGAGSASSAPAAPAATASNPMPNAAPLTAG